MRYLPLLLLSIIFSQHDHSGHDHTDYGLIEGQILFEDTGLPVEFATVTLLLSEDQSIINGTITNPIGTFKIQDIPFEQYDITIEFLGYETYIISNQIIDSDDLKIDFGIIMLTARAVQVDEVSVESEKSFQQNKIDRKVYNADVLGNTKGGDATEILEQIPSITVDIDGNINLRGNSNVTILIDGRKSSISVDAIASEMIETVEVMTTPSAKYDPDGTAGVINLILKKNEFIGTTGSLNTNFAELFPEYNRWHQYGFGGELNYFEKKMNIFSSFNFQSKHKYGELNRTTIYYLDNEPLEGSSSEISLTESFPKRENIKIGVEYYPGTLSTIAFDLTFIKHRGKSIENMIIDYPYDENQEAYERSVAEWKKGEDLNYGFGYFIDFDENHNLSIQFDYDDHDDFEMVEYDMVSATVLDEGSDRVFAIDYVYPIGSSYGDEKQSQIEFGIKHDLMEEIKYQDYNDDTFNFDYDQDRLSSYFNLAFYFSESFGMQFGSRFESSKTNSIINHDGDISDPQNDFEWALFDYIGNDFSYDYERIYPSLFFLYDRGKKGTYKFEFGRRINRPWHNALNPFPDVSSPEFTRQGNPYLEPEDIYKWEISYSNMTPIGYINMTFFTSEVTNQIDRHKFAGNIDGESPILTWINKGKVDGKGLEFQLMTRPTPNWNLMIWGNYWNNTTIEAEDESMLGEESGFYAYIMSKLKFRNNEDFDQHLQLSGHFSTPMKINNGEIAPMYSLDATYKREISKKFSISLTVKDLFDTRNFDIVTNNILEDGINEYLEATHRRDTRKFIFSLEYKFGEFKKKKYIRGEGHSHDHDDGGGMSY
tara:strand:- start:2316 stop:4784 length:2469 start_codon:yes stop_codon:yes gene_type:complete